MIHELTRRIRRIIASITNHEDAKWLPTPAGCHKCGTGGPHYTGHQPQVTRYVYDGRVLAGSTPADATQVGWTSCSRHPLTWATPIVDYKQDVVITTAQTRADLTECLASGKTAPAWATPPSADATLDECDCTDCTHADRIRAALHTRRPTSNE